MADGISFERTGAIGRITLDRAEMGNAIDLPMAHALREAAFACDGDDAIRCVLLTGAGRIFCAGGDVGAFAGAGDGLPHFLREILVPLNAAIACFLRMEKPLVVAVNGAVAGAGVGLAVMGDVVLLDPSAQFRLAYTGVGLSPDAGATWLLPRLIGLRRAQSFCLTDARVRADEAVAIGLGTRIAAAGMLEEEAMAMARALAAGPTAAFAATRRLLLESLDNGLETQLELESRAVSRQGAHREGREGVRAFAEKRAPVFGPV